MQRLPTALEKDFRNFLFVAWKHLGLPNPTEAQYEIARFLQYGFPEGYDPLVGRSDIIRAFRGVGKSWISAAFVDWRLALDPADQKIMVVSKSGGKAGEFVDMAKKLILTMPELAFLRPSDDQRNKATSFDVRGAGISQQPSLKAMGIEGQLPGNRATLIIGDDVETPGNSATEQAREKLLKLTQEFESIVVPAVVRDGTVIRPKGDQILLGTPQTEESIYNRMVKEMGFNSFTIPARFPAEDKLKNYELQRDNGVQVNILAPYVLERLQDNPALAGKPVDPERFGEQDLISRESKGRSNFTLQFMLDTSLSDANRYPLKQSDLTVLALNHLKAPLVVTWGRNPDGKNLLPIPNVGFSGDVLMSPLWVDTEYREYEGGILYVDPSGQGEDETGWAVVKALNSQLFVLATGGVNGNVHDGMVEIAKAARRYQVDRIMVEPNYAGNIWIAAFQPVLSKFWPPPKPGEPTPCAVELSDWAKGQKEKRIIDTLEPVMNRHGLIVDEAVARDQTLMYQITHITKERGSLQHDDRIDALAGAVAYFENHLRTSADKERGSYVEQELQKLVDEFESSVRSSPMGHRRTSRIRGREVEVDHVFIPFN